MVPSEPFVRISNPTMPRTEESRFRFESTQMDLISSILYDKEVFLASVIETSGKSPEDFVIDWIIEEYPIDMHILDKVDTRDYKIRLIQEFRIRLKTDEERTKEIKEKTNDDPSKR